MLELDLKYIKRTLKYFKSTVYFNNRQRCKNCEGAVQLEAGPTIEETGKTTMHRSQGMCLFIFFKKTKNSSASEIQLKKY